MDLPGMYLCVETFFYLELNSSIVSMLVDSVSFQSIVDHSSHKHCQTELGNMMPSEYYEDVIDYLISAQDVIMPKLDTPSRSIPRLEIRTKTIQKMRSFKIYITQTGNMAT